LPARGSDRRGRHAAGHKRRNMQLKSPNVARLSQEKNNNNISRCSFPSPVRKKARKTVKLRSEVHGSVRAPARELSVCERWRHREASIYLSLRELGLRMRARSPLTERRGEWERKNIKTSTKRWNTCQNKCYHGLAAMRGI